ncbi:ABC transporter ATP-binding protein [Lonsdalea quercina]|uniref:ABC transporter ATP-binding protein n=1 Tax=Lonsdalea quercina TaxID=71657 RepID=UPI003975D72E
MTQPDILSVRELHCGYPSHPVLDGVTFSIHESELVCLLAESGEGKSTLLKTITGLIAPTQGQIVLGGTPVNGQPPSSQSVGMVFQDDALFPHLTVKENVRFGMQHIPGEATRRVLEESLALMGVTDIAQRYPHELSKEQCLRGALARTLACRPSLLLLDSPFTGIDSQHRYPLLTQLRRLLKQRHIAALFVTTEREDAFAFADHLMLMRKGHLVQQGVSADLYYRPVNRYTADFMGYGNYLPVKITGDKDWKSFLGQHHSARSLGLESGMMRDWLVRPQEIALALDPEGTAVIEDRLFLGTNNLYQVRLGDDVLLVQTNNWFEPDQPVRLSIRTEQPVFFPPQEGKTVITGPAA